MSEAKFEKRTLLYLIWFKYNGWNFFLLLKRKKEKIKWEIIIIIIPTTTTTTTIKGHGEECYWMGPKDFNFIFKDQDVHVGTSLARANVFFFLNRFKIFLEGLYLLFFFNKIF